MFTFFKTLFGFCVMYVFIFMCFDNLFVYVSKVDFASQESQMAFYRSMQASGQDIRDFYEIPPERRYIVQIHLI